MRPGDSTHIAKMGKSSRSSPERSIRTQRSPVFARRWGVVFVYHHTSAMPMHHTTRSGSATYPPMVCVPQPRRHSEGTPIRFLRPKNYIIRKAPNDQTT